MLLMCPTPQMVLFYNFLSSFWCRSSGIQSISLFLTIHLSSMFSSPKIFLKKKNAIVTRTFSSTCKVAKVTCNKKQLLLRKSYCNSKSSETFQLKFPTRQTEIIFFLDKRISSKKNNLSIFLDLLELVICKYAVLHKCPIVMCIFQVSLKLPLLVILKAVFTKKNALKCCF